jgi:predicted CopG family antitoxin
MKIKNINAAFIEDEYNLLIKAKGDKSWHDFILSFLGKNTKKR